MVKTNKEIRSDLANKYGDQLIKVNKTLKSLVELGYSKEEIKATKERLISNLQNKLLEEEGYKEARQSYREKKEAKHSVAALKKQRLMLQEEYKEKLAEIDALIASSEKKYKETQINYGGTFEQENEVENTKENLKGNKEAILEDLKNNHVKVETNVEMMGYKGKKVYIDLPAVGKFKGFRFNYFVSRDEVTQGTISKNSALEKESYDNWDVRKLLAALNRYMKELAVDIDVMDVHSYGTLLSTRKTGSIHSDAGEYLNSIMGLDGNCWLADRVDGINNSRVMLYSYLNDFYFWASAANTDKGKLFLKLDE